MWIEGRRYLSLNMLARYRGNHTLTTEPKQHRGTDRIPPQESTDDVLHHALGLDPVSCARLNWGRRQRPLGADHH